MELGMVGLGRMGANMVRRLVKGGHTCVVYDVNPAAVSALSGPGVRGAGDGGAGLPPLRPERGRPLREDGP